MLIDSFLFFNETELVELRIKYLEKIVNYFVVIEADITHQGKKKGLEFSKNIKKQFKRILKQNSIPPT